MVEGWEASRRPSHASGGSMLGSLGGPGAGAGAAAGGGPALDGPLLLPRGGAIQAGLCCTLKCWKRRRLYHARDQRVLVSVTGLVCCSPASAPSHPAGRFGRWPVAKRCGFRLFAWGSLVVSWCCQRIMSTMKHRLAMLRGETVDAERWPLPPLGREAAGCGLGAPNPLH